MTKRTIYTVKLLAGESTLEYAARKLQIGPEDLDADYGLVPIVPTEDLYAVAFSGSGAFPVTDGVATQGPFSDPQVESTNSAKD